MLKSIDYYEIVFYSDKALLNKLNNLKVVVYDFKKVSNYKFNFATLKKNKKIINSNFNNAKIIKREGVLNYLEMFFIRGTFFSVTLSLLCMVNVSKRIWKINIVGDYKEIETSINEQLVNNNLKIKEYYPSTIKLKEIENNVFAYLTKDIEFLEIRRSGSVINVKYQKRRKTIELPNKGSNLYATKNGVIRYFKVKSGTIMVKEYDYVKEGELLVSESVETSDGKLVKVGTEGSVYANTFYVISVESNYVNDEATTFSIMLDKAKKKINEQISKDELIEKETILDYKIEENNCYMKVYYMLLEDITI